MKNRVGHAVLLVHQQVTHRKVVVLYASIIYNAGPLNLSFSVFCFIVGLRRGAERRAEGWSRLQRAGHSGPDHLPGNITHYIWKINAMTPWITLTFFPWYHMFFSCQGRNWLVRRSYEDFRVLDKHLHLCIYDRRYSQLTELPRNDTIKDTAEVPESYSSIISYL